MSTEPPQDMDHFFYTLWPSGWALGIQLVSDAMGWSKTTLRTSLALCGGLSPWLTLPNVFKLWSGLSKPAGAGLKGAAGAVETSDRMQNWAVRAQLGDTHTRDAIQGSLRTGRHAETHTAVLGAGGRLWERGKQKGADLACLASCSLPS